MTRFQRTFKEGKEEDIKPKLIDTKDQFRKLKIKLILNHIIENERSLEELRNQFNVVERKWIKGYEEETEEELKEALEEMNTITGIMARLIHENNIWRDLKEKENEEKTKLEEEEEN